jgi:Phospholipase_D-nuclease N-terminal
MNFWDFLTYLFWVYLIITYLMILFAILIDIFRDKELGGGMKAVWLIFLVLVPFLTALVYVISRGSGMSDRGVAAARRSREAREDYIRDAAAGGTSSPADEITKAQALLDNGSITRAEFDRLKAQALGGAPAASPEPLRA